MKLRHDHSITIEPAQNGGFVLSQRDDTAPHLRERHAGAFSNANDLIDALRAALAVTDPKE